MKLVTCKNAYYIKLGQTGKWEESSIKKSIMRIGWESQTLADINSGNWTKIQKDSEKVVAKVDATRGTHALRMVCESTNEDIWITFHASYLWWCKVGDSRIRKDSDSKYREVDRWRCKDIKNNPLLATKIPGRISKIQGFRGTICQVHETEELARLINGQHSPEYIAVQESKDDLCRRVENGLQKLHWKDFETLADLVFQASGWHRVSMVGGTMKSVDIELKEPILDEMYQVQVKSSANKHDFQKYKKTFAGGKYRKLFFVVHTYNEKLAKSSRKNDNVQIVLPKRMAEMVVELGLLNWMMDKIT